MHFLKWFALLLIVLSVGCSFRHEKEQPGESFALEDSAPLSFAEAQNRVFTPYCVRCHFSGSAEGSLESYSAVTASLTAIKRAALIEKTMPKGGSLPPSVSRYLERWIDAGGPEKAVNTPVAGNVDEGIDPVDPRQVSFAMVKEKIFAPKCIDCHVKKKASPLDNFDAVKGNIGRITVALLVDKTMPPRKPLNKNLLNLFKTWLKAGVFELPAAPLQIPDPNFASLKKNLFDPYCLKCHSGEKPRADVSFDSLQALQKSPRRPLVMEDEGDPDTSLLMHSFITPKEDKRMPPARTGPRMPENVIDVVRTWILNGAPEE